MNGRCPAASYGAPLICRSTISSHTRTASPSSPAHSGRTLIFSGAIIAAVAVCAFVFGPYGPSGQPDPTIIHTVPKPDFFFLWIYAALAYLPPIDGNALYPDRSSDRHCDSACSTVLRRGGRKELAPPSGCGVSAVHCSYFVGNPYPSGAPSLPGARIWTPGAAILCLRAICAMPHHWCARVRSFFKAKQCRNCHAVGGVGGQRGPALDLVATRMTEDQMIRQVLQGGGNMPAYGKNLSPPEVTALVSFLETLHPPNQVPAADASRKEVQTSEVAPAAGPEK